MRREIFLFNDFLRLKEFLGNVPSDQEGEVSHALGVGFFSTSPLPGGAGVGLQVAPPFLEASVRARMTAGHAAPYSREVLLFGDDASFGRAQEAYMASLRRGAGVDLPDVSTAAVSLRETRSAFLGVSRWLLAGVHAGVFRQGSLQKSEETWPAEVAEAASPTDAVHALLSGIHEKVIGLRPMSLVFLLETGMLSRYFNSLSSWKKNVASDKSWGEFLGLGPEMQEEVLGKLVLSWLAEEGLHPRVAVVCRSSREHESLLLHSHWSLVKSASCANVLFRL